MLDLIRTIFDLSLVILGFGFIVFVHELGHFVAARWAGIRVLAFALGFGRAAASYRKGLGFRLGSSEPEYFALADRRGVSPTEYRLNVLPFGGYVKMLGQDDMNPLATSAEPDSYQSCKPGKRMVVISAGVVMNLILAAVLFVLVFMAGLPAEPPKIGFVAPGRAAALATPIDPSIGQGLKPGDRVVSIDGTVPDSFSDVMLAAAMSAPGQSLRIGVERPGLAGVAEFEVTPRQGEVSKLMELGVAPTQSLTLVRPRASADLATLKQRYATLGLEGVEPGMRITAVNGQTTLGGFHDLAELARASLGAPMKVRFEGDGRSVDVTLAPKPEYQASVQLVTPELTIEQRHLLGLTPVLRVSSETDAETAPKQGLMPGDVFARVGAVEYPSVARGIAEIKAHAGRTLDVVVLRRGEDGLREVALTVNVSGEGRVGFLPADTADDSTIVALPMPLGTKDDKGQVQETANPAAEIITRPGVRIAAIEGRPVENFAQVRAALVAAVNSRERPVWVEVQLEPLGEGGKAITRAETRWILDSAEIAQLNGLGWTSPVGAELFEAEQTIVKADGPVAAISKGLKETKRVMLTTYVTFARLFQGTVKVEHLKGPVGIAHLGTMVAEQGWIKLLFFLALISVNLAVINFLPLPIVDGGQFVFLVIEAIRGKPVSERIQGAATLAGLALIGTMFLIVTFHDVMNLLR